MLRLILLLLAGSQILAVIRPGGNCENSKDCVRYAYCNRNGNKCMCITGFKADPVNKNRTCIAVYDSKCQQPNDCSGKSRNYTCTEGKCVCHTGYLKTKRNICIGYLECSDDANWCTGNVNNTECKWNDALQLNSCQCKPGYVTDGGICKRDQSYCTDDSCRENGDKNAACNSSTKCECSKGYQSLPIPDQHLTCTLLTVGTCSKESDTCEEWSNAVCVEKKCVCRRGYAIWKGVCYRVIGSDCQGDDSSWCHLNDVNTICTDGDWNRCVCKDGLMEHGDKCVPAAFGKTCTNSNDCSEDPNAECKNKKCVCKIGTAEWEHKCLKVLGTGCQTSPSWCPENINTKCNNFTCVCKDFFKRQGDVCVPVLNSNCSNNEGCSNPVMGSMCDTKSSKCVCKPGFIEDNMSKCVRVLNSSCTAFPSCSKYLSNTNCVKSGPSPNTCQCDKGYLEKGDVCVNGLGSACKNNNGPCKFGVDHVICRADTNKQMTCQCDAPYYKPNGVDCINVLGSTCHNATECSLYAPKSECQGGKCVCRKLYADWNGRCIAVLNSGCDPEYHWCSRNMNNTRCVRNESNSRTMCKCSELYREQGIDCITVLNNHCGSDNNCPDLIANSECLERMGNWTCECKKGYYQKDLKCTKVLNSPCTYHSDCPPNIVPNSYCLFHQIGKGICKCQKGYVDMGEQCEKDAKFKPVITMKEIPVWKSKLRLRIERKQKEMAEEAKDEKRTSIWWVYLIVVNLVVIGVVAAIGVALYLLPSKQLAETDYDYEDDEESDYSNSDSEEFSETSGSFESETDESE